MSLKAIGHLLGASAVSVVALSAAAAASAAAQGEAAAVKASRYTLTNGLTLVVIPDHRAPVVTHMVWYRVGGADDPPGLSGAAHFFEHLMFRGTKEVPNGELSKIVARNGGQDNAQTTEDFTVYFQRIAKDRLPLVMGLEADRMTGLDLSDSNVVTERNVVLEERHLRIDSNPQALAEEQLDAALHLSHPYGRPVIGWEAEISTMNRAQAMDFYQRHYAPNNATVMVVGDVDPEAVRKLAQEKYGGVPMHALAPRVDEPPPPRLAETRIDFHLAGVRLPVFMREYRVPSYAKAPKGGAEALDLLAEILGGGPTSRLYRALVLDKKLAVDVNAFYQGHVRGPAELGVFVVPRDGVSFESVETEVDRVLNEAMGHPPQADELQRAKTKMIADHTYQSDNQFLLAQDYGTGLSIGLSIADVEDWPNRIRSVTAADVATAAKTYLKKEEAVTGRLSALAEGKAEP